VCIKSEAKTGNLLKGNRQKSRNINMTEVQFTATLNGFNYEVTQTYVCGSMLTCEKSKYVNRLVIKDGETIILDTFWEGKEPEVYLRRKAREEVSWFLENRALFTFT
jgi:hypothetical protein